MACLQKTDHNLINQQYSLDFLLKLTASMLDPTAVCTFKPLVLIRFALPMLLPSH